MARFIGAPLVPGPIFMPTGALERGEPPLPTTFAYAGTQLQVASIQRTWRSTNTDRGDTYLARHWFEVNLVDGRVAVVYFDRKARSKRPRWWLYTLAGGAFTAP